ncbi:hypothetical protein MHU86_2810 [Fragilaria crotonensis]|nr:hypothetical protein MHU86_2810 [Fragilaria crotonensis]
MTMTAHAAIPAPPDPVAYHDPHHPTYGFHTSEWHKMPRPEGDDWFPSEERYRREANAHAYRQHGSPQNWFRYLTLGFFVYDDCSKFDALWKKYSSDPIICHRMVWYNFMHHVDRKFEISNTLSAWATDVSQPYLQRHAPQFLSLNTLESTWSDYIRGDHDVMDIDVTNWTTVGSRKKGARSVSPPPVRNEDVSNQNRNITHPAEKSDDATNTLKSLGGKSDISTVPKDNHTGTSTQTIASETSSTIGKQSALQPTLNVPTNNGTYRLTFCWNPKGNFNDYNETSPLWLKDVHSMMSDLFSDDTCRLFRWESTDLQTSSVMSDLSPGELREFISPKITFLTSTSQVIFGARVCFASSFPNQWKNNERTLQLMKDYQVQVSISNSSTNSGKIVTAGYILFKAARTTHRNRFLQSLRQRLPKATPFFDILLFHRTPMEQKINHLVVQCGENHVSPLSQALSALLTGCNSPLYLSRLALANLQPSQISRYFEMQDIYSKSLKSFPLFPTLSNLDRIRNEFFEDGTVMERSTRDWASTIFSDKTDAGARCEVVNGGFDQKAYILVPPPHASIVQEQLRQYRLRINPIGRREAGSATAYPDFRRLFISTTLPNTTLIDWPPCRLWTIGKVHLPRLGVPHPTSHLQRERSIFSLKMV